MGLGLGLTSLTYTSMYAFGAAPKRASWLGECLARVRVRVRVRVRARVRVRVRVRVRARVRARAGRVVAGRVPATELAAPLISPISPLDLFFLSPRSPLSLP